MCLQSRLLAGVLALGGLVIGAGCEQAKQGEEGSGQRSEGPQEPDLALPDLRRVPDRPDLSKIVPWKAVNLLGPTDRVWEEYDYRPRAEGGLREEIDERLRQLKRLGVRQVQVQTMFSFCVESTPYPGTSIRSTVYYNPRYRPDDPRTWGRVPRNRRGDMGAIAYQPPASWDVPTPLRGPLEINAKAEAVLGEMLEAVAAHGLVPVLKGEIYLTLAEDGSRSGVSPWFIFTDPSRNFDQFYRMYQEHLVAMTRVAARHRAAMHILGTELPYVAGAGQSYFADGSRMVDRHEMIAAKWREIIRAVRQAALEEGRPDLVISYTEINPFWEDRRMTAARVPVWTRVPFWDELDAVGINFYLPGRWSDGRGNYDTSPKTAADMVRYGETHNFATDFVPNMADIREFFHVQRGYTLETKPVFFAEDGCTSSRAAAANPAAPPFLRLGEQPDFAEQQNLYEAHFVLFERYGKGWLAGLGFWQVTPSLRWGGPWNAADPSNYATPAAYFSFLGTPTEETVRRGFSRY
ncbi:MAG: hypothetical protein RMK29_02180 [Myxococcales bacterium]|nr:hypothetical protein [Myxococcota bacterium]MDW8280488.1 hypothetical protein [Myxococcales bacterium]